MKKILVPIDYSSYPDNAVHYAIEIAKKINAELHFCHGFLVQELAPIAGMVTWPTENYIELKEEADKNLRAYIATLKNKAELNRPYFPNITYSSEAGTVKQFVDRLTADVNVLMMIHRHPNLFSRILEGSHTQKLMNAIHIPLLVMPED